MSPRQRARRQAHRRARTACILARLVAGEISAGKAREMLGLHHSAFWERHGEWLAERGVYALHFSDTDLASLDHLLGTP